MKIIFLVVGKTNQQWIANGMEEFAQRLRYYCNFSAEIVPDVKAGKRTADEVKRLEGQAILKHLLPTDQVFLLDEGGKEFTSRGFANFLQKQINASPKRLFFVVGGAFGFDAEVYNRANGKISLSKMTFTHQMIRPYFAEQLYRGFTILRGEKYHND